MFSQQIQPVQQKNTVSFVNQFTMRTVQFLNRFAQTCESRFMNFEYKLQKVEASLLILESQVGILLICLLINVTVPCYLFIFFEEVRKLNFVLVKIS